MHWNPKKNITYSPYYLNVKMLWNRLNTLYNVVMHFYLADLPAVFALFLLYYIIKTPTFA
jgi:hypothetical protein